MKKLQTLGFTLSRQQMKKIVGGYDTCEIVCQTCTVMYSPPSTDGCDNISYAANNACATCGGCVCISRCCGGCN